MTREDFFRAFGEIDERFVEETVKDFENGIFYEEGIGMSVWRKVLCRGDRGYKAFRRL